MASCKHGHYQNNKQSPTYMSWQAMHQRCRNKDYHAYNRYGGRGIEVCAEWSDFRRFLADMGVRPMGTTLDRINNDGPYTKDNCRWATRGEQARNSKTTKLSDAQVIMARELYRSLRNYAAVGRNFGVSGNHIRNIVLGTTRKQEEPSADAGRKDF